MKRTETLGGACAVLPLLPLSPARLQLDQGWRNVSRNVPKLSKNFEEILSRARENFVGQNKNV